MIGVVIISKQLVCQKFIYKIHSQRLRRANWRLTLPIDEARRNDEVIALADSLVLRWIDEINGLTDTDAAAREVRQKIKAIKKEPNSVQNRRAIRQLYRELDSIQYKPDYMCLIIDKDKDYYRACKGFTINGVSYKRLLGTNGGIKNSTIVFVSEKVCDELRHRIENGRNPNKALVTAKLEAYKALTCSASTPVSLPRGVAVVSDVFTHFIDEVINLNDEFPGDPVMTYSSGVEIEMDACDGYGMMLPSLASRWSQELNLDYVMSGCNTRFAWSKGMVFTFDFVDFADKVAHNYIAKDIWGNDFDVRNVELILTESMVKLWDSYKDIDDYMNNSLSNKYTFGITKVCPKELESERSLNYQFIQPLDLNDNDIEELIKPTMDEIKDVLGGDWKKSVLFLKGAGLKRENVDKLDDDVAKAIMINPSIVNDQYVKNTIYQLIRKRIDEAKVGVLNVHGNYSIVSGDVYGLCQHIFGLKVTGLLGAGEIYNKYWCDCGSEALACYRAPMTCINNIRPVKPTCNEEISYWYKYMNTCTVFNSWDTAGAALNGMDFDGDLVMLTDNPVIVRRLNKLPALMCAQRRAEKRISTEDDFIRSNIESFGNDIGRTTNWVTSMFEVQSHFDKGSKEYETLGYRIKCGQLYQQNAIDKAKGIICKPMPRDWYDRHVVNKIEDEDVRDFYRSIIADKKPYFMRYIYPALMKQYNTYIKNTNKNSYREFQMSVDELLSINEELLTERQKEFIQYYKRFMPVGIGDCSMNKICKAFELAFDGIRSRGGHEAFDYSIMKSGELYSSSQYYAVKRLYDEYNKRLENYKIFSDYEHIDKAEANIEAAIIRDEFVKRCEEQCSNGKELCDIILDICYSKNSSKRFAWSVCGHQIIKNLLAKSHGKISFPTLDGDGEIEYCGNKYRLETVSLEVTE